MFINIEQFSHLLTKKIDKDDFGRRSAIGENDKKIRLKKYSLENDYRRPLFDESSLPHGNGEPF